jgi:NTP pyrophosphatase (non-canonical NTP hydrolase)
MQKSLFNDVEGAILKEVLQELRNAKKKHPRQPRHVVSRAAIVSEEVGELVQAAIQFKYERGRHTMTRDEWLAKMRKEAIQVIVTGIRFIENLK